MSYSYTRNAKEAVPICVQPLFLLGNWRDAIHSASSEPPSLNIKGKLYNPIWL